MATGSLDGKKPLILKKQYKFYYTGLEPDTRLNISSKDFGMEEIDGYEPIAFSQAESGNVHTTIKGMNTRGITSVLSLHNGGSALVSGTAQIVVTYVLKSYFEALSS